MSELWRKPMSLVRGCCLPMVVMLLVFLGACVALGWSIGRAAAARPEPAPTPEIMPASARPALDVCLVIDQSDSLWTLGGTGSDPNGLRMAAVRLFAARLAAETEWRVRLAIVYFGSEARLVVPLGALDEGPTRAQVAALGSPPRMGWTDIVAAVNLAEAELYGSPRADPATRKAVVVFTDGRPETAELGKPEDLSRYLAKLEERVNGLTHQGAAVFTVLLRNAVTDADPVLRTVYRPFWVGLAERGASVRFYDVRAAEDLATTYHDIAVLLGNGDSQGAVVNQAVADEARVPITLPPGWRRATFVVSRSSPQLGVSLVRPDGQPLTVDAPGISYSRSDGPGFVEVWAVEQPPAGVWAVRAQGRGTVTVWLDYVLLPASPTPVPTADGPRPTVVPTLTPSASLRASPRPPLPEGENESSASLTVTGVAPVGVQPGATPAGQERGRQGGPGLGWLALVGLGAGVVGWVVVYRRRLDGRGWVDGRLRLMAGPPGMGTGQVWNLGELRRRTIRLGRDPGCEVVLSAEVTEPPVSARIEHRGNGAGPGETWLVKLAEAGQVRVNRSPVRGEVRLTGWDVIEVGEWTLRYENLRERAQAGAWSNVK